MDISRLLKDCNPKLRQVLRRASLCAIPDATLQLVRISADVVSSLVKKIVQIQKERRQPLPVPRNDEEVWREVRELPPLDSNKIPPYTT